MTCYRIRAVLLLFLMLHLTACYTWQGVATTSPGGMIEATQPDRVRVVVRGEGEVELENPSVEGDQLVGTTPTRSGGSLETSDASVSLEDILQLEIRNFSWGRTVLLFNPITLYTALFIVVIGVCSIQDDC